MSFNSAVIVFPGSNCDRDVAVIVEQVTGAKPAMVWHRETALPSVDLIVLPGGFSYGDYLRSGAMAAHSPIVQAVKEEAKRGVAVLGICNGFQILTEAGLLPGTLMRNASLHYICRDVGLKVERADTLFTNAYAQSEQVAMPIAHKDGAYFADDETLDRIESEGQVVFRYCSTTGTGDSANPNGSRRAIAGVIDKTGRIMGLMPHPERAADAALGGIDGRRVFESLTRGLH
jgi:phosphoribosylformylglycinamidine synthase